VTVGHCAVITYNGTVFYINRRVRADGRGNQVKPSFKAARRREHNIYDRVFVSAVVVVVVCVDVVFLIFCFVSAGPAHTVLRSTGNDVRISVRSIAAGRRRTTGGRTRRFRRRDHVAKK